MNMCRNGLHDKDVTGVSADGRCLMCRRAHYRRKYHRYMATDHGRAVRARYEASKEYLAAKERYNYSTKGVLTQMRYNAARRQRTADGV